MGDGKDAGDDEMNEQMRFAHGGSLNFNHVFAIDSMGGFKAIKHGPPYVRIQAWNSRGPWWVGCAHNQRKGETTADENGSHFLPVRKPIAGK